MSGTGGLLISAAAGYWVLTHAAKEKSQLKRLGQFLGIVIIAASLIGSACKVYRLASGSSAGAFFCPTGKACPFTGKRATTPQ